MGFLGLARSWRGSCNHRDSSSTARHAALQQAGELGVPERNMHCIAVRQLCNHSAQSQQALVDEAALPRLPFAVACVRLHGRQIWDAAEDEQ